MAIKIVGIICGLSWLFLGVVGLLFELNPTPYYVLLEAYRYANNVAWISTAMLIFLALAEYSRRAR